MLTAYNTTNEKYSINFIDKNNIRVEYDLKSIQDGEADWFISKESSEIDHCIFKQDIDMSTYWFDITKRSKGSWGNYKHYICFPLTNGKKRLYLYLLNHHSGEALHGYIIYFPNSNNIKGVI